MKATKQLLSIFTFAFLLVIGGLIWLSLNQPTIYEERETLIQELEKASLKSEIPILLHTKYKVDSLFYVLDSVYKFSASEIEKSRSLKQQVKLYKISNNVERNMYFINFIRNKRHL